MTDQEKIIISAYTGILMCDFDSLHKYIEDKLDRSVLTHELASKKMWAEISEKSKSDFLAVCAGDLSDMDTIPQSARKTKDENIDHTSQVSGLIRTTDRMGRVMIPKELRNHLGWGPGTKFEITPDGNGFYVKRLRTTRADLLRQLSDEELARYNVYTTFRMSLDYDYEEESYEQYEPIYKTSDGSEFDDEDAAILYELSWLRNEGDL